MIFTLLLLSFAINFAIVHTGLLPYDPGMTGSLIAGVMAQQFTRQGVLKSLPALIVVTGILALLLFGGIGVLPLKRNAPRRAKKLLLTKKLHQLKFLVKLFSKSLQGLGGATAGIHAARCDRRERTYRRAARTASQA